MIDPSWIWLDACIHYQGPHAFLYRDALTPVCDIDWSLSAFPSILRQQTMEINKKNK
jgi:hypothetical protein